MKKLFLIITLMWCCVYLHAQRHIVFSPDIASLQVVAGTRWQELPVIRLNGNEPINISFDELSHDYRRLTYRITHLEADFTESADLFASDYIEGFQEGQTIEDTEQSINTVQLYTHYSLQIPNRECRLKMSGNYRVDIIDDNESSDILASAFFMVTEDIANAGLTYSANTDIDIRKNHQQVELKVDYSKLRAIDPRSQVKGYVLQNNRWDNAVTLPQATRINQQYLEWTHCRPLIFEAGNEYHKFEILDVHLNSMNVEHNYWDGEEWHTQLWPDYDRRAYVYDETPKGAFFLRNSDNYESSVTSEYVNVHFLLKTAQLPYPLYVSGMWTTDHDKDTYLMEYDVENKQYEAVIPLKYGYYSYHYVMLDANGVPAIPPSEGSFYETRNTYTALIYYRGNADRADRLVGVSR